MSNQVSSISFVCAMIVFICSTVCTDQFYLRPMFFLCAICTTQADMLGANDCGTITMTLLDAICNAHENLAKVIEIMPKLVLSVNALAPSLTS